MKFKSVKCYQWWWQKQCFIGDSLSGLISILDFIFIFTSISAQQLSMG